MEATTATAYEKLLHHLREIGLLGSIESLLGWDERVLMPAAGGDYRAAQAEFLAGQIHQRWTDPALGELLDQLAESELASDPRSDAATTIRQARRDYARKTKLPRTLVEELARLSILGQQAWVAARKADDFAKFQPLLERIVVLKREEAQALGYAECPYDALLEEYEPGEKTSRVATVLAGLRAELVPLVKEIRESGKSPDVGLLKRSYPIATQKTFGRAAAEKIGFSFTRGRLDDSVHPFCSDMGPHDCRLTSRYDEHEFNEGFFGILHEAGHGLYEQGLRPDQYRLPPGLAVSLGIHESQSRMWENLVGRSQAFWEYFFPLAQQAYPQSLGNVRLADFYFAINDVRPSLIRVEADEATYNLHILVRFELEQALINDGLAVADLPAAWNEKYESYLGIKPPSDADGVLQDIHWSSAAIGYFATYSLGNLYAAQFFAQADRDLGGLAGAFRRGEFLPLREWLRTNIHSRGQKETAAELVQRITGRPLSHGPLMAYLRAKYAPLYGI